MSLFFSALAQNEGKITGRLHDKAVPIVSATVSLLKAQDSAVIKSVIAEKDGSFTFDRLAHGNYIVVVTATGYQKSYSDIIDIRSGNTMVQLPPFTLLPAVKSLSGVTVTAKRPLIEQKIDRTIVNVEASITNTGATALEVLEKSPGITVDKDGNISLKGKEGVMVLVDGRPTQLGGADLANLLRSMNASQLDQIEIMTNPPARYDAAGNAGVINIKTKKNKQFGYNGSVNIGYLQGRYPKANSGFNMNYRQGKVNITANINHNYRKYFETLTIQRYLRSSNSGAPENYFDQQANMIKKGESYNAKVGVDYFLNKQTSFGVAANGFYTPSSLYNRNTTNIATAAKELEHTTRATVNNSSLWKNLNKNFNFRHVLDTAGKELTAEVDHATYDSKSEMFMVNSYFNAHGNEYQKADTLQGNLPQDIKIITARIDYLHPLKKGARFEAGIKAGMVTTDNNAGYDSIQYGLVVPDYNRSNHFVYEENINAAYVNLSAPITKKISTQLGLRLENTNAMGHQRTTGQRFNRLYTQVFPTAYFQYKADKNNNLGLNYGRRIRRPNYESLNPFVRFIDRYTYNLGNPDLKPQISDNIELTHSFKNILTTTLNYSATNDIIQNVLEQKGQEAYVKKANIASLRQLGLAVNANMPVTKWWTNNLNVNVFQNRFEGLVNNIPVHLSTVTLTLNGAQQFKLSPKTSAEISGAFRSASIEGVIRTRPMGMLAVGLSHQVLKNNGMIRLTVRDILYTQKFSAVSRYGNVDAAFQEVRDSRVVNLGFSYRFSKGKVNGARKRTSGSAADEQNRVGVE